ncbi:hypothetical protein LUZ60_013571 [Juncus effusus]|nr:hypothetical protein LUZ60_013571 [Juncus effusus]
MESSDDHLPLLPDDAQPQSRQNGTDHEPPPPPPPPPPVKRKAREDLSDGESPFSMFASSVQNRLAAGGGGGKKTRQAAAASSSSPAASGGGGGGDYRKDREEWSDSAINSLLDSYTERFEQLNRGNLRGRDWEDVASIVSENCEKSKAGKTVEQCKNKIDNLKKRYKVECQRLSTGTISVSHWPWFKKMETIVASAKAGGAGTDDEKSASPSPAVRQKRYHLVSASSAANMRMVSSASNPRWKRVLLKVSGAALSGAPPDNVDPKAIMLIAREIQVASRQGVQIAVVVGGRNIFSGDNWISATGVDRAATYQICMMASVMNAMLLQASLEKIGVATRVQTAFTMQEVAETYIRRKAISHLEKGRVVIFGGIASGLNSPLFTTDAAAALRASEIHADVILKGTTGEILHGFQRSNENGGFEHISYRELISRTYSPIDTTAVAFCEENNLPVVLFNLLEPGCISRAITGDQVGTLVDQSGRIS